MPQDVLPSVVTKKAGRNFPRPPFTVTKPQRNGLRRLSPPPRPGHCDVDWVVHFYQFCYYFQNINRKIRECKSAEEFFRVCGRKKRNASVTTPAVHNCLFSRPGVQQISRLCGSLLPHLSRTLHFHIIPTTGQRQERNIPCGRRVPAGPRQTFAFQSVGHKYAQLTHYLKSSLPSPLTFPHLPGYVIVREQFKENSRLSGRKKSGSHDAWRCL